jgi:tetratricopeptide (TPR) repeat protein
VVLSAKHDANAEATLYWRTRAADELDNLAIAYGPHSFMCHLLTSRFYRGVSYAPYLVGDRGGLVADMDLCEAHANALAPKTDKERIMSRENWLPSLQSRAKEARWLGDLELARERLQRAVDFDPADSIRWLELGEIHLDLADFSQAADCYVKAACLSPPGTAVAWFMAGECERLAGHLELSFAHYQQALRFDPLCTSATTQLKAVSRELGWDREVLDLLEATSRLQDELSVA